MTKSHFSGVAGDYLDEKGTVSFTIDKKGCVTFPNATDSVKCSVNGLTFDKEYGNYVWSYGEYSRMITLWNVGKSVKFRNNENTKWVTIPSDTKKFVQEWEQMNQTQKVTYHIKSN